MELASLHQASLHIQYHAMRIYTNAPSKHAQISKILREASAKLAKVSCKPRVVECGSGYYDCNGECIADGTACKPAHHK